MQSKVKEIFEKHAISICFLIFIFALYCFTAPFTVQSMDTGELVTNSYFLRVSHPPGYPLWTLLFHLPTKYFPFIAPFHNAAIFNSMIAILWLGLLAFRFKGKEFIGIIFVLATSTLFWRYAVLPDVFGLHMLFLTLVFLVFEDSTLLEKPWIIFLVSLSVTNHHTIVFFFPLYVYAILQGPLKKRLVFSLIFGFTSISIYGLLLIFHPDANGSWRELSNLTDVINHFLRKDYGTFRLHAAEFKGVETSWLHLMFSYLIIHSWSVLIILGYAVIKGWRSLRQYWVKFSLLFLSTFFYLMTFLLGGILPLDVHGQAVFERFLLQPILSIFFITLLFLKVSRIELPRWLILMLLVNGGLNITQNFEINNYRHNTIIEDFALNTMKSLPEKSIYHVVDDTQGNATYYLYDVMKVRNDIVLFLPSLGFSWSQKKTAKKYPDALNLNNGSILDGINFKDYSYYINIPPFQTSKKYRVIYTGLVFEIKRSETPNAPMTYDCEKADKFNWRFRSTLEDLGQFEISVYYDTEYGRCYFTRGLDFIDMDKKPEAMASFEKAVEISPLSAKFRERLCVLYKELQSSKLNECEDKLAEIIALSNKQYYLSKYE